MSIPLDPPDDALGSPSESGATRGTGWYAVKTRETRAFLAQLRPDENGDLPGYRPTRRRRSRSKSNGKLFRRLRNWWYRISSPLP